MSDLVLVPSKPKRLIVCPGSWDGMSTSVTLTRYYQDVEYHLYCPEDDVSTIFQYPAVLENTNREIVIAGVPWPVEKTDEILSMLEGSKPSRFIWYSHHFWSGEIIDRLGTLGVQLILNSNFDTTSELVIDSLGIEDKVSLDITSETLRGLETEGPLSDWLYLMLAVKEEYYEIRHALSPLFKGQVESCNPDLVNTGKTIYEEMSSFSTSTAYYRFDLASRQVVVVGLPLSLKPHYRLIAKEIANDMKADLVVVFFDKGEQALMIRGIQAQREIDFLELAKQLDRNLNYPIRMFDRGLLLIGPDKEVQEMIENALAVLKEIEL